VNAKQGSRKRFFLQKEPKTFISCVPGSYAKMMEFFASLSKKEALLSAPDPHLRTNYPNDM
jgi:hypothetical protein